MQALISTFGIDWHLLLAQGVNFLVLVGALSYFLYKPVIRLVKEREAVVAKGIDDAAAASEQLKEAESKAHARARTAEAEAEEIVKLARADANVEKSKIVHEAEARAAQVAKDAEARAVETAARAQKESEKEIARLAILAAEKVLQKHS
jgi:F-type H+-transporting ATPase subunit b